LVPFLLGVLADRGAQLGLGTLVLLLAHCALMPGKRRLEHGRELLNGAGLRRQLRLRLRQPHDVVAVHFHEDVVRRALLPCLQLSDPLLVLPALCEQRLDRLDLLRLRISHEGTLRFPCRAASRMRAACSRLSIRWWAMSRLGPTAIAP